MLSRTDAVFLVDDFPQGFPRLAYLQSSNKSFAIYRTFRYLCARVLLHKQVELNDLEKQLTEQDDADRKSDLEERRDRVAGRNYATETRNAHFGPKEEVTQPELIQVIFEKLKAYGEHSMRGTFHDLTQNVATFSMLVNQVASLQEAPTRDHESVLNWIMKEKPLRPGSDKFIWHKGDFVSLKRSAHGGGPRRPGFFGNIILALAPYSLLNVSIAR